MGCVGSAYENLPLEGSQQGFFVVPNARNYMRSEPITLKLKEKMFSITGDDIKIKDIDGNLWFTIKGSAFSIYEERTMKDANKQVICGYRKKQLSLHATAYITGTDDNGGSIVYATIKRKSLFSSTNTASVYIHQPPIKLEAATTEGLVPDVHVIGDMVSKKYDILIGDLEAQPTKIAKVEREWRMMNFEQDFYYLTVGPGVDVAFICILTYAIDELFTD